MHPLVVAILVLGSLGGGFALGLAVKSMQLKTSESMKRLLAQEREKGRLEGSAGRGGLEPPKPWTGTDHF